MKSKTAQRSVSIIGLGNWGSSLAHALHAAGVPLHEVILPSDKHRRTVASLKWAPLTTLKHASLKADILWLCVPDSAIPAVTRSLVRRAAALGSSLEKQIVVHSSGALSAQVLESAAAVGAATGSVHPMMSFPNRKPVALQGVPFGIEADASSRRTLHAIVRRIDGHPFSIKAGNRGLYHAVGMLSSPLLVSHLVAAQQTATLAGFSRTQARALIEPIVRVTLDNLFVRGARNSVSGPIARGDVPTIRLHLQALQPHPMLADVYRSLALYALELLPSPARKQLRRLLQSNGTANRAGMPGRMRNYKGL